MERACIWPCTDDGGGVSVVLTWTFVCVHVHISCMYNSPFHSSILSNRALFTCLVNKRYLLHATSQATSCIGCRYELVTVVCSVLESSL